MDEKALSDEEKRVMQAEGMYIPRPGVGTVLGLGSWSVGNERREQRKVEELGRARSYGPCAATRIPDFV